MSRKNYVLEGEYKDKKIRQGHILRVINDEQIGFPLSKYTVASYEVINEETVSQFSAWKALMGMSALGSVGMVWGIDGDSRKEYLISINWKDGEKSLILIDHDYYVTFVQSMLENT